MLKKVFFDFGIFWLFFGKKQPKLTKNEENWQNPNRLVKFSEIWYLDASQQQQKCYKKLFFRFQPFLAFFWAKKQSKFIKNEEKRPNSNRLIKFSEIWYVDVFQRKKIQQTKFIFDFGIFWPFFLAFLVFFGKKLRNLSKFKLFDEIF